jgi:hypothetical protein
MKITIFDLCAYKELHQSLRVYAAQLANKDEKEDKIISDFFIKEDISHYYKNVLYEYYEEVKKIEKTDLEAYQDMFPDDETFQIFSSLTASDLDSLAENISPKEVMGSYLKTKEFIVKNADTFKGTEYWDKNFDRPGEIIDTAQNEPSEDIEKKESINFNKFYHKNFEEKEVEVDFDDQADLNLEKKYQEFLKSSLYQNALAACEKISFSKEAEFRDRFYQAINAADEIKILASLIIIFEHKATDFFKNDKRYTDFLSKYLSQRDQAEFDHFLQNKVDKKYIILFLRLIIEQKLKKEYEESAVIGSYLSLLSRESGEIGLSEMAFADEENEAFDWADI